MTATNPPKKRKSSARAQPKRTDVYAAGEATSTVPAVSAAVEASGGSAAHCAAAAVDAAAAHCATAPVDAAAAHCATARVDAAAAHCPAAAGGDTEVMPASGSRADGETNAAIRVQLERGLEIKDVEGLYRVLSAALLDGRGITVDVGRVQAMDTAGAQLLLAFQGEASRRGVSIELHGESAPLMHALAALGLRDKFSFVVPHG